MKVGLERVDRRIENAVTQGEADDQTPDGPPRPIERPADRNSRGVEQQERQEVRPHERHWQGQPGDT